MNHYMDLDPYFIRERNEQIRREMHSLRLGEQLQKKPQAARLASSQHNHKRLATRFRCEALGALNLIVGTVISYLSLPKEER